jgi:uncharacterized protein DUF4238
MSEAKLPKHHYIPVFYLNQWRGSGGKVVAFRRHHGRVVATPKPPKRTGYVEGLYWLHGFPNKIANRIEEAVMGHVDHNAAIAHRYIMQDKIGNISTEIRSAWTRFVVGLLIRSPANIKNVYDRMMKPSKNELKQIRKAFGLGRYEDIPEDVMRRTALYAVARLMDSPGVEQVLNSMRWFTYDLGLPELRFFTSDRPVIMTDGIGKEGGHLVMPVSPHKLFLAFHDRVIEQEITARSPWDIADTVNARVVRNAIEVAWDVDDERLLYVEENLSADAGLDRNFFKSRR